MRKLAYVLLLLTTPVWAEWTLVSNNDADAVYTDLATIIKRGKTVEMWTLIDFKNAQRAPYGPEYLSLKSQVEYDCDGRRTRVLQSLRHSGQMGGEEVVYYDASPGEWKPVQPGSTVETLWKFACKQ